MQLTYSNLSSRQSYDLRTTASDDALWTLNDACFWAANLGLAWVPFWFGGNREFAWHVNALYFGALVLILESGRAIARRPLAVPLRYIAFPAAAFALVGVWIVLQDATWTPVALHHPLWQWESQGLDVAIPGSMTINRAETEMALLRLLTASAVFWLFLQLCRSAQRAYRCVQAVALIGALYAAYGIVAFFALPGTTLWFEKTVYLESVTSTFINRNSYATYAGVGLVCALGVMLSEYGRCFGRSGRPLMSQCASFIAATAGPAGAWMAAAFLLAMALALTGSRGGILASAAGVLAWAVLGLMRGRSVRVGIGVLIALVAVGCAILTFGDLLAERLLQEGLRASDRLAVYRLTLISILDLPWTGFGYGTFKTVFPMYRDASLSFFGIWDKAHNTYLEIIQGLGIPMAALLFVMLSVLVARCAYAALVRQRGATAPLVATSATVIVALHSFVDFSMQIQAVALTWTALLAAGNAQFWSSAQRL